MRADLDQGSDASHRRPEDVAGYPGPEEHHAEGVCSKDVARGALVETSFLFPDAPRHCSIQLPPLGPPRKLNNAALPALQAAVPSPPQETLSAYSQHFASFAFDESASVDFFAFKKSRARLVLYYLTAFFSLGLSLLLCHWFPRLCAHFKYSKSLLREATIILCKSSLGVYLIAKVRRVPDDSDALSVLFSSSETHIKCFEYNYSRFIFNPANGLYVAVQSLRRIPVEVQDDAFSGLSAPLRKRQHSLFGPNDICVQAKSTWQTLYSEILHPFNVFQGFSIVVWCFEDYYVYAAIILLIAVLSITTTLVEMHQNYSRLREMAHFECKIRVFRDCAVSEISSTDLVPGDTVVLSGVDVLPCDVVLLNGEILVDESMLSGESIPVAKQSVLENPDLHHLACMSEQLSFGVAGETTDPAFEDDEQDWTPNSPAGCSIFGSPEKIPSISVLFSGTKIIRARRHHGRDALGVVLNTGMYTTRGNLIQSILFPRPNNFRFYRDSLHFIALMAAIACVSFIFSMAAMRRMGYAMSTLVMRALDLITVVVPPALPATMSIATAFSIARLKRQSIFCISPPKIPVSSNIDLMCFDKTGTLTEDGFRLKGIVPARDFVSCTDSVEHLDSETMELLASCHSVQRVGSRLVGDPLDVEMFSFTGWILKDQGESLGGLIVSGVVRPGNADTDHDELGILKTFEFVSSLCRMTVLVKGLHKSVINVFAKGSPEGIKEICVSGSLPPDYDAAVSAYARRGYRLLAFAGKQVGRMSWLKLKQYPRKSAEHSLTFMGLIVFENHLKPNVDVTLKMLKSAGMGCLLCTGDNPLTAVCVSRICGIVSLSKPVFLASMMPLGDAGRPVIRLENLSGNQTELYLLGDIIDRLCRDEIEVAITGPVFEHLSHPDHEPFGDPRMLQRLVLGSKIYARMNPSQKQNLVELLQSYGRVVGFCGDGANDCGALKAADVGISLSQAEASIAAPFTCSTMNIDCVPLLIKEGRASLSTSFSCFKFMTLYSMIQFTSLTCLFLFHSYLTDSQFIYSDLVIIIPLGVLLSRFGPSKTLSSDRPPCRLMSLEVLVSIVSFIAVQAVVLFANALMPSLLRLGEPLQNTAVFLTSSFLYPITATIFSIQHPHRQKLYGPFYISAGAAIVFPLLLTLNLLPSSVCKLLSLELLNRQHAAILLCIVALAGTYASLVEFLVIPRLMLLRNNRLLHKNTAPLV